MEEQNTNKYWQDRWAAGRTGWHKDEVNQNLEEFYQNLGLMLSWE